MEKDNGAIYFTHVDIYQFPVYLTCSVNAQVLIHRGKVGQMTIPISFRINDSIIATKVELVQNAEFFYHSDW